MLHCRHGALLDLFDFGDADETRKGSFVLAHDAAYDKMESFAPAKDADNMENTGLCPSKKDCQHG
jgi:hypothetical protein